VRAHRCIPLLLLATLTTIITSGCDTGANGANGGVADGDTSCDYQGKTIDFAVPYDPGGGYDQYARMIAPHLEKRLGATVVVLNEPGAGGLLSLNRHQSTPAAKPRLQLMEGFSSVGAQSGHGEGVQYDLTKWPWVGRIVAEPEVVFTGAKSGYRTWDDVAAATGEVKFGSAGPGGSDFIQGTVLKDAFHAPITLATGFQGTSDIVAGLLRGDVALTEASMGTTLPLVKDGQVRPLMVIASQRAEELPDVPTPADYAGKLSDEGSASLAGLTSMIEVGRAVAATPGTSPACLRVLRDAFTATMSDQEFLGKAKTAQRPVDPLTGQEVEKVVGDVIGGAGEGPLQRTLQGIYGKTQ
jgi:tripartite-type tricarboxylate transporter receptor subunit TctC